jgi:phosphate transport system permease protein
MKTNLAELGAYLRSHKNGNLAAGLLVCVCGGIVAAYGILMVIETLIYSISGSQFWSILPFSSPEASFVLSLFFVLAAISLFVDGYLLTESHHGGVILASIFSVLSFSLLFLGVANPILVGAVGIFCAIGGVIGFLEQRKTHIPRISDSVIEEKVIKLYLRLSGLVGVGILFSIITIISARGIPYVTWDFLTQPFPWAYATDIIEGVKSGVIGIGPQIAGSLLMCGLCELISIPLGLGSAIYLSEYSPQNFFTQIIHFFVETLAGVPSVILGLFGFTFFRLEFGWAQRSLLGGAICLALMILPWNIRVAEEAIKTVSTGFKEAAYALGSTKLQTIRRVILEAAAPGILTGVILGFGAAFGEAAVPLLAGGDLTANWPSHLTLTQSDIPTLPVWIYSAYKNLMIGQSVTAGGWKEQNVAYAGAFVLLVIFLAVTITALLIRNRLSKKLVGA